MRTSERERERESAQRKSMMQERKTGRIMIQRKEYV